MMSRFTPEYAHEVVARLCSGRPLGFGFYPYKKALLGFSLRAEKSRDEKEKNPSAGFSHQNPSQHIK
jgi:hypothetical protein